MEKVLSQEEIDALLKGVVSGEVDTAPKEAAGAADGTAQYDLLNQERIIRGRMPTLELINDRFIRRQSVAWTGMLREAVDFLVVGTQVIKFGELLKKVPMPSSLNVFHMHPLRGNGLFIMDAFLDVTQSLPHRRWIGPDPAARANAAYEGVYLLGTSIARPLIAKRLIEIANQTSGPATIEFYGVDANNDGTVDTWADGHLRAVRGAGQYVKRPAFAPQFAPLARKAALEQPVPVAR